jgi:hypothetical protein
MKQETLEEAAKRLHPEEWDWREREIFIEGAEWYKKQLKYKIKEAIEIIEKLEINEISKQGGISSLKLILNEK